MNQVVRAMRQRNPKMKRIRKIRRLELTGVGFEVDKYYDQERVWINGWPCTLRTAKRLHDWLGKAIQYLEQMERGE